MKIFISGGSGFIGTRLASLLLDRDHEVTATGTSSQHTIHHDRFEFVSADTSRPGAWQRVLKDVDVVVNLAGKSIFRRWTRKYKRLMYDSRILTTRQIVSVLPENKPVVLLSTSAVGFYGNRGEAVLTEDAPGGNDFLADTSRDWEAEALQAEKKGARVVLMRFGIVLGRGGGAVEKMLPAFRFFVGGPMGSGDQWFPWIHMDDLLAAVLFSMDREEVRGPVNFCAPNPVRNRDLAKTLGKLLRRPSFMPAPALMMRWILGEFASALLSSQRAIPERLSRAGFRFSYPDISSALSNLLVP